jgi:glycosyltransferase involved in cell wall biosynthesis
MASISYCVSVCNEHEELDRLLSQLITYIEDDELIVLVDESKVTSEVGQVISKFRGVFPSIKIISAPLNGDFGTFKNNFTKHATKDYIFQIDADELLSHDMLEGNEDYGNFKVILDMNPDIELFWIPRENYVDGLTPEYIQQWGWRVDEKGRVNWKDPQARLFKNNGVIKWQNKVHEVIVGHKSYVLLPDNYFILHRKALDRQIKQNEMYSKL